MYISDRRMIALLQDVFGSRNEHWIAIIEKTLRNFIAELPKKIKEALVMRYDLEHDVGIMQVPAIAMKLKKSQAEVSAELSQGMQALKNFLITNDLSIITLTPEQTMQRIVMARCRLIDYNNASEHKPEQVPPQFFLPCTLPEIGFHRDTLEYLDDLNISLLGEVVLAPINEFEKSPLCTPAVYHDIKHVLEKFNLKRGMLVSYENIARLLQKIRTHEPMFDVGKEAKGLMNNLGFKARR